MAHVTEPDRTILESALRRACDPATAEAAIAAARWDSLLGCWLTTYAGMTVGVEPDGYVHS